MNRAEQLQRDIDRWRLIVPEYMQQVPNWVLWRARKKEGRITKPPYQISGKPAKANDSSTWATFEAVLSAYSSGRYNGIGLELEGSNLLGIDLDHCIKDGKTDPIAIDVIKTLDSYTELSPSGDGVHIWVFGANMPSVKNRAKLNGVGLEMYVTARFLTITGIPYTDNSGPYTELNAEWDEAQQDALDELHRRYWEQIPNKGEGPAPAAAVPATVTVVCDGLNAEQIIDRIEFLKGGNSRKAGDCERILNLFRGNWQEITDENGKPLYQSQSEADQAFLNTLAFWAAKDATVMEEVFKRSGLYRQDKWEKRLHDTTYGAYSIQNAINTCTKVYTGERPKDVAVFPVTDDKGKPLKGDIDNTRFLLRQNGIEPRFNLVTHNVDITVWGDDIRQVVVNYDYDAFITQQRSVFRREGLPTSREDLLNNVYAIAMENAYNPLLDYFRSCYRQHKGSRGEFAKLCAALPLTYDTDADREFAYQLLRKWLRQCIYLAGNNGDRAPQSVLVLRGRQNIGKSTFVMRLLPQGMVLDGRALDVGDKDSVIENTSVGIVELAELGRSMTNADELKMFFTRTNDRYRAPYDKAAKTYPRRTSYVGTINDNTFLIDRTGDRRFFVLPLADINRDLINEIDIQKLWAEIGQDVTDKLPYNLTNVEAQRVTALNRGYNKATDIEQNLLDCLHWDAPKETWQRVTPSQVSQHLYNTPRKGALIGQQLAAMADRGDIEPPCKMHGRGSTKCYLLPPLRVNWVDE